MSEEIFEIYDFIKDNELEISCYDYEFKSREIIVFITPIDAREFLELIAKNVSGSLDDGGYEITITSGGVLAIEIMDIIDMHCNSDEGNKWFNRFKKYSR